MSDPTTSSVQIIKAGLVYFALVMGAGFLLGTVRVPFMAPRLGERLAELIEMPLMLVVIGLSARFVVRRFALPPTASVYLAMLGLFALMPWLLARMQRR